MKLNLILYGQSMDLKVNQHHSREFSEDIFDEAVEEVWKFWDAALYKDFLNSLMSIEQESQLLNFQDQQLQLEERQLQSQEQLLGLQGQLTAPPVHQIQPCSSVPKIPPTSLEPLIEGQELRNKSSNTVVGLTREALKATQKFRSGMDQMPVSLCKQKPKFPYHFSNYNSYNPVSRQDSEVQSFSSGCLTDSEAIIETRNKRRSRKTEELNCDNLGSHMLPAQNARCPKKTDVSSLANSEPGKFAAVLIQKLNAVIQERERGEKKAPVVSDDSLLAIAIRDKLHLANTRCIQDETQPDDILDEHVSRVWSDVTPDSSRSPPGRRDREYKRMKAAANTALRPRIHMKFQDQEHQLPKSKTFPSAAKYDQDSGISITTTSTSDDVQTWLNNSCSSNKPSTKTNPIKTKKKEISCVVFYQEDNGVPFCFKIPTTNVSLNVFKEYLPKKGNYRYFFKCNYMDEIVNEEIIRDDSIIPLHDGKVVAYLQTA
ncbi:unnamed protein product [Allacma fusca]|uniref:DIX domain-containing protein n=1 Tax=Allacma fusca TaxID=39272 RepID=A0A8J2KDB0_9HEXA|nr:unnamed protein product [Allacma fusca]